jgi:(Z)-2-((N-methylformamido)methylene)-5-hydroxybutyrolactone dehydrogenase
MQRFQHFTGGRVRAPASGRWFDSFDPYTAKPSAQVAEGSSAGVDSAVTVARCALDSGPWSRLTATECGALLQRLGDIIAAHAAC